MKIIIITQNENLYLPNSFAIVCKALSSDVVCIVTAPAMSTHGGPIKGFIKHFQFFGIKGTFIMGVRVTHAKLKAAFPRRSSEGTFYSIQQVADFFNVPYREVPSIRDQQFQDLLDEHKPDLLVSISCPQVIGKKIRNRIPMGCINVHGAPLPKYRGLMPAFWALCNGETKTAVSVHDLEAKLDDGDIILQREIEISPEDTWNSLVLKTKEAGARALVDAIQQIKDGTVERKPNLEQEATYYSFPTAKNRRAFIKAGRRFF